MFWGLHCLCGWSQRSKLGAWCSAPSFAPARLTLGAVAPHHALHSLRLPTPALLCPPTVTQVLDKTRTRKLMQAIASLGPALCLVKLAADQVRSLWAGWDGWLGLAFA